VQDGAEYRKAIELDPKLAAVHHNLGLALHDQGKVDEAIAEYRTAIELDPKYAAAHNNLGNALYYLGKLDEAVAEYRKAIELDPKSADPHNGLGAVFYDQKKLDEAIAEFRKAIELDPKKAGYHNNLGNALHDLGKLDEAVPEFRKAIELDPKFAGAHHNLTVALLSTEQFRPAAEEYRCRLKGAPEDLVLWLDYASTLLLDRNNDGYEQVCKQMLEGFRQTKEAEKKYLLARILSLVPNQVADRQEAIKLAQEAVEEKSGAWYGHTLALACYRADRFEEAVKLCEESMKRDPDWEGHVVNWLLLAMAHQRLGHAKEAHEWWAKAVQWIDQASEGKKEKRIDLPVPSWSDRLEVQLLLREADALLKTEKKGIPKK
jgi:superkiller protein 3